MVDYIATLRREIAPALGCTEPIAAALAAARACETLGMRPERIELCVSRNILKNAMNVGIPGTGMKGLEIAAALSAVVGRSEYGLEVLRDATPESVETARGLCGSVAVTLADTDKSLYILARAIKGCDSAECIIEDTHTNITRVFRNGVALYVPAVEGAACPDGSASQSDKRDSLTVEGIYAFATTVHVGDLEFLRRGMDMNMAIAREGMTRDYGMRVGRRLSDGASGDYAEYAVAMTAAAADARMGGCTLPVMSTAGSGNQGLAATLPCMAVAERLGKDDEQLLRAEAISQLVTIHIKAHIGKLSALCGCAIAASVGSACGITYLLGGTLNEISFAVQNMIADIAGLICDGAKAGCALKIATGISAAMQCVKLAMAGCQADKHDGIVMTDVERSIENLGELGVRGMTDTDRVILEIMMCK